MSCNFPDHLKILSQIRTPLPAGRQVPHPLYMLLRDYQCVPFCGWVYIQKSQVFFVLINFITWDLPRHNFTKHTFGHTYSIATSRTIFSAEPSIWVAR